MKREERIWGRPTDDCRISVSAPERQVEAGRPVILNLIFQNGGSTIIRFPRVSLWFEYDYTVTDREGRGVAFTPFGEQQRDAVERGVFGAAFTEVAPGQEIESTIEISRLYELSRPGVYKVAAWKELPSPRGQGFIKVVSNTVEFEIVEARQDARPR